LKEQPGIVNRRFDLRSVSDDARVPHQTGDIPSGEGRYLSRIEAGECLAKIFTLVKDGPPREPGLESLENQELVNRLIVADGSTPLVIVIGEIKRIIKRRPSAPAYRFHHPESD
jgi:hypothetical protein